MVFLEDFKDKLDIGTSGTRIIISEGGLYVEGHKGIGEFRGDSITFYLKKGELKVSGGGFKITCISHDSACVKGKIKSVEFE
ncbi:MAG: YabP/YqfC family sporulation protein [Clostridiales bacterium]|jgi:sporulation protein YqfC|nr:YabP/YqfC family sporulation protein [Clostridiales bacterium]